jgi:protease I
MEQAQPGKPLQGKRIAMLMTDGVEQIEYTSPRTFLEGQGATVVLVAPKAAGAEVQGVDHDRPGARFRVELDVGGADPDDFDALVLPGGAANPASLRTHPAAIDFIRGFDIEAKMVAAICHGPLSLIDAGIAATRHLTSAPAIRQELQAAGAEWTDDPVVIDARLVTSRRPNDLAAFNDSMLKELMVVEGADPGLTS